MKYLFKADEILFVYIGSIFKNTYCWDLLHILINCKNNWFHKKCVILLNINYLLPNVNFPQIKSEQIQRLLLL